MKLPLLTRALVIAGVGIAVLVPIHMIDEKISERRARAEGVVSQFAAETAGPQVIVGPFLAITCEESTMQERNVMRAGKAETVREQKVGPCPTEFVGPKTFRASGILPVDTLHRGLYTIRLYRASVDLTGEFAWPGPPASDATVSRRWKHAYLVTYVRDARGIKRITSETSSDLVTNTDDAAIQRFSIRGRSRATRCRPRRGRYLSGTGCRSRAPRASRSRPWATAATSISPRIGRIRPSAPTGRPMSGVSTLPASTRHGT